VVQGAGLDIVENLALTGIRFEMWRILKINLDVYIRIISKYAVNRMVRC